MHMNVNTVNATCKMMFLSCRLFFEPH